MSSVPADTRSSALKPRLASPRHTAIFIAIFIAMACYGLMRGMPGTGGSSQAASQTGQLTLYLSLVAMEFGLFRFVAAGIRSEGQSIVSVTGCRLLERRGLLRDLGLGLALTALTYYVQLGLDQLPGGSGERIFSAPTTVLEIGAWLVLSSFAGVCEEFAFRGYLQSQLKLLSGSVWISIVLQAVVFGVGHAYQGVPAVARIVALGLLFGVAATRCRTLRPLMLAHALSDVLAGLLT